MIWYLSNLTFIPASLFGLPSYWICIKLISLFICPCLRPCLDLFVRVPSWTCCRPSIGAWLPSMWSWWRRTRSTDLRTTRPRSTSTSRLGDTRWRTWRLVLDATAATLGTSVWTSSHPLDRGCPASATAAWRGLGSAIWRHATARGAPTTQWIRASDNNWSNKSSSDWDQLLSCHCHRNLKQS